MMCFIPLECGRVCNWLVMDAVFHSIRLSTSRVFLVFTSGDKRHSVCVFFTPLGKVCKCSNFRNATAA